jgi:predicted metal-binding membrane protein
MVPRVDDRRPFLGLMAALIVLAWLALWLWGESPSGRFLRHDAVAEPDAVLTGHGTDEATHALMGHDRGPAHPDARGRTALAVAGWTLMTAAMMLPTTLSLLAIFHAIAGRRPDRGLLVALLVAGYLGVWAAFGAAVHVVDLRLHAVAERIDWLAGRGWLVGAAALAVAGLYQFTPLKHRCLDRCRSPLSFVMQHWRGRRERLQALWLGAHHGLFCVGCCWALMLLMFAVGVGSLAWMLLLGAIMAAEKNLPAGRRLSASLGFILLAGSAAIVLGHSVA